MGSTPIGNAIFTAEAMLMPEPLPSEKRIIRSTPGPEGAGMRLDLWLAARFTYRSRAEWQNAVRRGEILLNGASARPARILRGGETVEFIVPDLPEPPVSADYHILADFPQYIVVDKPGDLPVHPSGRFFNHTLLMLLRRDLGADFYPVNRIDRETSGIVVFARTPSAAARLSGSLAKHPVRKKYLVFVHGCFPSAPLRAAGWLSADPHSTVRKKRRFTFDRPDGPDPESSDTEFIRLKCSEGFSELSCLLHTGRLHQIRATLCSLGFPVVGDKLYGLDDTVFSRFADGKMTDADKKTLLVDRQCLHASEMEMTDPFDGKEKRFVSPLPPLLSDLENRLFR